MPDQDYSKSLRALIEASKIFGEARLDLKAVLGATAKFSAEFFEDGCFVRLFNEDKTRLNAVAYHHVDEAALKVMGQLLAKVQTYIDGVATTEILRTGVGVVVNASFEQARSRVNPEFAKMLESMPVHSWMIVPLKVSGEIIGMITTFRFRKAPGYTSEDKDFLQDLADRSALSIHNAQLYENVNKAVQLRDEFISLASHELKTPITALKLQLQIFNHIIASEKVTDNPRIETYRKMSEKSDQQIARLTNLIDGMLDVTKLSIGHFKLVREKVNLTELVTNIVEQFAELTAAAQCAVELQLEPEVVGNWDPARIEQVIGNLLGNAIKFGVGKPIKISLSTLNDRAILKVQDYGIGIAKENHAKVFGRFERLLPSSRFGGLGLGLHIAQEIVLLHDGMIGLESELGQGATFIVELPLNQIP